VPDQQSISVDLDDRSYPIVIGSGLIGGDFDLSGHLVGRDCLVVSNETVAPLYLESIKKNLTGSQVRSINLADGEAFKTMAGVESVIDSLADSHANRDITVIALGGGVVGDIAGFAAACYMRGVAFVQVPTTLLAQVDSSVGGKTGVNHPDGKNLIGAFHQPQLVLIDTDTLTTLPDRELKAGLAEVIKYGVISDVDFFTWLESNVDALLARDADALSHAIQRSCEIKAAVVSEDERETGQRALLNFGHTFAHAIENCLGYGAWLHGEAVAAGMVMAAALSDIDQAERNRVSALIAAAGLPVAAPEIDPEKMLAAMQMDKKVQAKRLRFVLLRTIGDALVTDEFSEDRLNEVLRRGDGHT
jgi:3-dehydroquinate synthase